MYNREDAGGIAVSDQELIAQIGGGDKESMQTLIERYYDDIYRFIRYKCGNADLSYDLTQETFLRFIRYFHSYVEKGTFRSYLFRIAMNVINDHFHHTYQRDVLVLKYQYGLKAREIACIVNEKVPTVKSRIRQGLARLREIMREEERG